MTHTKYNIHIHVVRMLVIESTYFYEDNEDFFFFSFRHCQGHYNKIMKVSNVGLAQHKMELFSHSVCMSHIG